MNAGVAQLYTLCSTWLFAVLLKLLQGVLNGLAWVSIQYALGLSVGERFRGRAYSTCFALGSLGSAVGNILYSTLSRGSAPIALATSPLLFVATAALAAAIPEPPPAHRAESERRGSPPGVGGLGLEVLTAVASVRAASALIGGDLIYVYLREVSGATRQAIALTVGLCEAAGIAASFVVTWAADRGGDIVATSIASAAALSGETLFAANSPAALMAGYALFVIGARSLTPLARRVAVAYARAKGLVIGTVNAVGNISTAVSSPLMGGLLDSLGFQSVDIGG